MREAIEEDLPDGIVDSEVVELFFGPVAADDSFPSKRRRRRSLLEIVAGIM